MTDKLGAVGERHKMAQQLTIDPRILTVVCVALGATAFLFDLAMPLGVAGGVPYVALVLLGWWGPGPRYVVGLAVIAVALVIAGFIYSAPGSELWIVLTNRALAMVGILAVTALVVSRKHAERALRESEARYRELFESSPISTWEEDWSGVKTLIDELRDSEVAGFVGYFEAHPEFVARAAAAIRFIDVNRATLELSRLQDKDAFLAEMMARCQRAPFEGFVERLAALAGGEVRVTTENWADRGRYFARITLQVQNARKDDWSRVLVTAEDITARKQVEIALLESEGRFRTYFDNSPTAMYLKDAEGRYLMANTIFEEWYGVSKEDIIGKTAEDIFDDALACVMTEEDRKVLELGEHVYREGEFVLPDERTAKLIINKFPVYDIDGSVVGIGGGNLDITESKQIEEALRESETRFRQLFEQAPVAIIREDWTDVRTAVDALRRGGVGDIKVHLEANPDEAKAIIDKARIIEANEKTALLYGTPDVATLIAFYDTGSYTEDDLQAGIEMIAVFAAGTTRFQRETNQLAYDGSILNILVTARIVSGCEDDWRTVIFTNLDITDRKQAEEALQVSEERYAMAMRAINEGVYDLNISTDDMYYSERVWAVLGISSEELRTSADWVERIHPEDRQQFKKAVTDHYKGETDRLECDFRYRASNGEWRWARQHGIALRDSDGVAYRMVGSTGDITTERQAEEALRESKRRLAEAQHVALLGNWEWDVEAGRTTWSDEVYRIMGAELEKAGISDNGFDSFVHPGDRDSVRAVNRKASETGEAFSLDYRIVQPDGTVRHIHEQAQPTERKDGKVVRMVGIVQDITERKRAEETLREHRALLEHAAELTNLGYWVWGGDGRQPMDLSEKYLDILGFDSFDEYAAAVQETGEQTAVHEDDLAAHGKVWERARQTGTVYELECRIRRPNGEIRSIREIGEPVFADDGSVLRWVGAVQDITEYKQAEAALELTQFAMDHASDAAYWSDSEGRIVYANEPACAMLGYTRDELQAMRVTDIDPDATQKDYARAFARMREQGSLTFEAHHATRDGRVIPVEVSINFLSYGDIELMSCFSRDITERKAIEDQLRQAQKLEMVGQLTGGIAHDFNNLLAIIMGNLELAAEKLVDNGDLSELLGVAVAATDDAATLTQQLLAFSRKQPLRPQVADANALVGKMMTLMRGMLDENIELVTVQAKGSVSIFADPGQLESALLNLIVNARDAMPQGGTITIETSSLQIDETVAEATPGLAPGDYVVLGVSDTGSGMAPEVIERAFEPFFTTKGVGEGSGLGLSMVFGFVKQSGGCVTIDSEVGHGTTVKLYFPAAQETVENKAAATATPCRAAAGETILVVEDDERVRRLAVTILTGLGYAVLEAGDADAALAILDKNSEIELLFTDIVLPGKLTGVELARETRRRRPALPVLYASAYPASALIDQGRLESGVDLIQKPYRKDDLAARLATIFESRSIAERTDA